MAKLLTKARKKLPSVGHIKKDMKEEKEIMHEASEIKKSAKAMQKQDKAYLKTVKKSKSKGKTK